MLSVGAGDQYHKSGLDSTASQCCKYVIDSVLGMYSETAEQQ